LHSYKTCFYC